MQKCDKDLDGMISLAEFEHLTKMEDFEDDVAWDALFPEFTYVTFAHHSSPSLSSEPPPQPRNTTTPHTHTHTHAHIYIYTHTYAHPIHATSHISLSDYPFNPAIYYSAPLAAGTIHTAWRF